MLAHVSVLVTMRESQAPCDKSMIWQLRDIQPTDEEACIRIFNDISPENDPDVKVLLGTLTDHGLSSWKMIFERHFLCSRYLELGV